VRPLCGLSLVRWLEPPDERPRIGLYIYSKPASKQGVLGVDVEVPAMTGEWGRTLVSNLTLPLYVAERLGKALGTTYVQACGRSGRWSQ